MIRFTPILLAVLYAVAMYRFSVWRTRRELDARSTELADPRLKDMTDRLARALDLPRIRVNIYEIDPVNGLAAPDGRIFITRGFYRKFQQGEVTAEDQDRYNTVCAESAGSVAAPTAGLHFTPALLQTLEQMGVRRAAVDLHVGLGTFAPVRTEQLEDHDMHRESYTVARDTLDAIAQARASGRRLFVVGTTTVRALESLPDDALAPDAYPEGITSSTNLFIHPDAGFTFKYTDRLMTNFHLPQSTLLALVASLPGIGLDRLMAIYHAAVEKRYRFYSYGDAMLID